MTDVLADHRTPGEALRRRWRLLAVAAVLGLLAGTAYLTQQPPRLGSTALVLLPPPGAARGAMGDVTTQAEIVTSATVLGPAGAAVQPNVSARDLEKRVRVSTPTDQLLRIQAYAADGEQAQALAQSVAQTYVGYIKESAAVYSAATLNALTTRRTALARQVEALDAEIETVAARLATEPATSTEARQDAQLLAQLRTEQAQVALRLDQVAEQITTTAPPGSDPASGTTVIQPAAPATGRPLLWQMLAWPLTGATGLTLLAAAAVLARSRGDRRLRLRDEIADAAGARVLASLHSRSQRTAAGWTRLLSRYRPAPMDAWAARQALHTLAARARPGPARGPRRPIAAEYPASVTVLSLSGDVRGLALGPQLAACAAGLGITTRVVTGPGHPSGAALWNACAPRDEPVRPGLTLGPSQRRDPAALTLTLAHLDRKDPDPADLPRSSATVLAVGAGRCTEDDLARLTIALHRAGRRLDGVLVADPDRADRSTGRHGPDRDEQQVVLPMRITGGTR